MENHDTNAGTYCGYMFHDTSSFVHLNEILLKVPALNIVTVTPNPHVNLKFRCYYISMCI